MPFPLELARMYDFSPKDGRKWVESPLPSYTEQVLDPLIDHMRQVHRPLVLDIGSGIGNAAMYIKFKRPSARVLVTDVNHDGLIHSQRRLLGYHQVQMSGDEVALAENCVDVVHCQDSVIHFPDLDLFFKEMQRVMKRGGLLTLSFKPSSTAFSTVIAGERTEHKLKSLEIYQYVRAFILSLGEPGCEISPPYFRVDPVDILKKSQEGFECIEQSIWEPHPDEVEDDWYKKLSPRYVVTLVKK